MLQHSKTSSIYFQITLNIASVKISDILYLETYILMFHNVTDMWFELI